MSDYSTMTVAQLLAAAEDHLECEDDLQGVLQRAAVLAQDSNPALAMLFRVLSEEPSDVAATRAAEMADLVHALHVDTDGPALANIASAALAQFADE